MENSSANNKRWWCKDGDLAVAQEALEKSWPLFGVDGFEALTHAEPPQKSQNPDVKDK